MWRFWAHTSLFPERKKTPRVEPPVTRTPDRPEKSLRGQQIELMLELGFRFPAAGLNDDYNWMHLHRLLKDYRDRIEALEERLNDG